MIEMFINVAFLFFLLIIR